MTVETVKLSERSIKTALLNPAVTELTDPRYPLRLRFHTYRTRASWYLVSYKKGKAKWHKLATWPSMSCSDVIKSLPALQEKLITCDTVTLNGWLTVGELLTWYCDRALSDNSLKQKRRVNIKSSIKKHLIPCLGHELITDITEPLIDTELIWPLQSRYAIGTVRQHFALLKRAFKVAKRINYLDVNPLADLVFTDFIDAEIKAKPSKLKSHSMPALITAIHQAQPDQQIFINLMLAHGTRIGETRRLRWDYIDNDAQRLIIPAELTKTEVELTIPLTPWLTQLLEQHHALQREKGYNGPYLFRGTKKRGSISETKASKWVQEVSNKQWTAHDLRKLARTSWADLGIDYMVAEQLLNHAMGKLDKAYIHTYLDLQKRNALTLWHAELERWNTKTTPRQIIINNIAQPLPLTA